MTRVDLLCKLYRGAYERHENKALKDLRKLIRLAGERGYPQGQQVLHRDLDPDKLRALCWNVSSLLTNEDFEVLGYQV